MEEHPDRQAVRGQADGRLGKHTLIPVMVPREIVNLTLGLDPHAQPVEPRTMRRSRVGGGFLRSVSLARLVDHPIPPSRACGVAVRHHRHHTPAKESEPGAG
jgi:hypothetical protein